jgi:hypothetical protein
MKKSNLLEQILSLIVQIGLAVAVSFLYAVVVQNVWGWFIVPVAPTVLSPISFPIAYGLSIALSVFHMLVSSPSASDDDADAQADHPILWPVLKTIAKVLVVLIFWGIAAIAHVAIG